MSLLSHLLYRAPVVDRQTLMLTPPWAEFFAAFLTRIGGIGEVITLDELAALVAGLSGGDAFGGDPIAVSPPETPGTLDAVPVPPRQGHLLGGPLAPPSIAIVAAGAGSGATASVTGTDAAGTMTLTTRAQDDHKSNAELMRVTFAMPYATAPVVLCAPANPAAMALLYGRFRPQDIAVAIHVRQSDVTTTGFPVRCGSASLATIAETYQWNYLCVGA